MQTLAGIFSLLVAAAGWYYLFYSRAAHRLESIEQEALNRRRIAYRRVGGVLMLLLGVCFFAGFNTVDWDPPTVSFMLIWLAVFVLLGCIVILAMIDLRLTIKLRRSIQKSRSEKE